MKTLAAVVFVAFAAFAVLVHAEGAGRIEKIRESGSINLGHPESSVPFAFLDGTQKPVGYTVEICQNVVQELKAQLKLPKLDVRYTPVTSATRIPLLGNGTIDLECGNTTNNAERHKLVAFSPTIFVAQIVLTARKDAGVDVNDFGTFRGKTIAAQAGGQNFKAVSQMNAKNKYGITVVPTNDVAQTFLMMETGRAQASANDDALAYAQVATSKTPAAFVIGTKGLELAPYGIVLPKDDPEFKKAVDSAVVKLTKSGKVAELYEKYFNAPIPPQMINLKYPMSDALKRALKNPTDSPDAAAYE